MFSLKLAGADDDFSLQGVWVFKTFEILTTKHLNKKIHYEKVSDYIKEKKKVTCKWYINSLIFPDIICSVASMEVCVYHKWILYGKILKWNFWSFSFQNNNNSKTKKKQTNKRHLSQYLEQHNFTKLFYFIILHEKGISKKWCNNYVDRHFNKTAHINLKILL